MNTIDIELGLLCYDADEARSVDSFSPSRERVDEIRRIRNPCGPWPPLHAR